MAKDQGAIPTTLRPRGQVRAAPTPRVPRKPFNALQFWREVQAEARKVTWTSWKETWITSVMVGIMVVAASLFFFLVDGGFSWITQWVLKLGGSAS